MVEPRARSRQRANPVPNGPIQGGQGQTSGDKTYYQSQRDGQKRQEQPAGTTIINTQNSYSHTRDQQRKNQSPPPAGNRAKPQNPGKTVRESSQPPAKPKISTTKLFEQSSLDLTTGRASHISAGKQESDWKRQLIEHDIRLQTAKMQMIELQNENKLAEMRELLYDLQDRNQQIELEKKHLVKIKDKQIKELSIQVKHLEQQLIDANIEIANVKTKLSLDQQLV